MQQDYSAARILNPDAATKVETERRLLSKQLEDIFETISPFLPGETKYEIHIADNIDVGSTIGVDDGGQVILLSRHYIAFLRNLIEMLFSGVTVGPDGVGAVKFAMTQEEREVYGKTLGEYLEVGVPLTFPKSKSDHIGPAVFVAAIEFIVGHELVHRIEAHGDQSDLSLTGFQDFCRLRGREYDCDRRALGLVLLQRKNTDCPELAFAGGIAGLLALSWLEQFTPGFVPGGEARMYHPGSDSRVLRLHTEEQLFWRAAGLEGVPSDFSGAILRRAFLFMGALEREPKLIASPLNHLVRRCISSGQPNHALFASLSGELFARGKVRHVARSLGALWGAAEMMAAEEHADATITDIVGGPAMELFHALCARLHAGSHGARAVAAEMMDAKALRQEDA